VIGMVSIAVILGSRMMAATATGVSHCARAGGPSKLDYLVLASIADSPQLIAMTNYTASGGAAMRHAGAARAYPTAY
jgi:hypothetical protein